MNIFRKAFKNILSFLSEHILFLPLLLIFLLIIKEYLGWTILRVIFLIFYLYIIILPIFILKDKMGKERSLGITLFGILLVYSPLQSLLLDLIISKFSFSSKEFFIHWQIHYSEAFPIALVLLFVLLGMEILRLKEWAQKCVVWFSIIELFIAIGCLSHFLPSGNEQTPLWSVVWVLGKPSLFIWFFTRPKVKKQFKQNIAQNINLD